MISQGGLSVTLFMISHSRLVLYKYKDIDCSFTAIPFSKRMGVAGK